MSKRNERVLVVTDDEHVPMGLEMYCDAVIVTEGEHGASARIVKDRTGEFVDAAPYLEVTFRVPLGGPESWPGKGAVTEQALALYVDGHELTWEGLEAALVGLYEDNDLTSVRIVRSA